MNNYSVWASGSPSTESTTILFFCPRASGASEFRDPSRPFSQQVQVYGLPRTTLVFSSWLYGINIQQGLTGLNIFTKSRKATSWKFLPADSELDAIDTKSLQRFSQNFEADSKSFARSFSWWEIKIVFQRVNSFLLLRIYQSRSKIAFRFTNHVTRNTECLKV